LPAKLRLAYIAHTLRSDWNNGNAHFLRGLMRAMTDLGHDLTVFEPESGWSIENLLTEPRGRQSIDNFVRTYPDINLKTYNSEQSGGGWRERLKDKEVVILHEWSTPALAQHLLTLRDELGFRLLFHDTHHRASSSPEQIQQYGLDRFDGVLAFGETLRNIYRERFGIRNSWTLHEAADTSVFYPRTADGRTSVSEVVWIGNWGEGERSAEIRDFFLKPAATLAGTADFTVYGVRYPEEGLSALREAGVRYAGYLPNLDAPAIYAAAKLTVHIPRQHYTSAMTGIPTIRAFEALASGIPLISAPWQDTEGLFRPGDFRFVSDSAEMTKAMRALLNDPAAAAEQAKCGLETILARHTCAHRAVELTEICEELLS
jgi:spore maturation protein CgeB